MFKQQYANLIPILDVLGGINITKNLTSGQDFSNIYSPGIFFGGSDAIGHPNPVTPYTFVISYISSFNIQIAINTANEMYMRVSTGVWTGVAWKKIG